jgi:two-component system, NtrC family, response regulator AtoC
LGQHGPGSHNAMPDSSAVIVVAGRRETELERLRPLRVIATEDVAGALQALDQHAADVLLVDSGALDGAGLTPAGLGRQLLAAARERWPDLPVIIVASEPTRDELSEALAAGASDVVSWESVGELEVALDKALLAARRLGKSPAPAIGELVLGRSPAMRQVAELLARVAQSAASVLVRGESGTGKELVARALHRLSPLAQRPFIKIDCASLPDALLESELFGYEKGAFTGAVARKIGRVELAHGGTLFLDEAGELTLSTQAKLLRLLQDREFERLGGTSTLKVDVRIIAATHRDLETMAARGQFRQDLFYRLNVVPIWLPPLRARRDDVTELALHFCQQASERNGRAGVKLDAAALRLLSTQRWPGNVRQLQNFVERLVVLSTSVSITAADVQAELERPVQFATETGGEAPSDVVASVVSEHLSQVVRDAERQALLRALDRAGGNRSAAARVLGVSRSTFYSKLREYGLL